MSLYLRGKVWWVSLLRNGKHIQRSTHTSDKAKASAVESAMILATTPGSTVPRSAVEDILNAIYGEKEKKSQTHMKRIWQEYTDDLAVRGVVLSIKTIREKKHELERFRRWAGLRGIVYLEEVDGGVAKDFAISLTTECKAKRRQNILQDLSSIWNAITANHPNLANPWKSIIPRLSFADMSSRPAFTEEEEERVIQAAKETHRQWFVACMIARGTGLRYGDVCRLEWKDVNLQEGFIRTIPRKTQKSSGVVVDVPMEKSLLECLTAWSEDSGSTHYPNDRVLPWLREWGGKGIKKFSVVLIKAGLDTKVYTFHSWRHTFRSRLAKAGVTAELAMKLCGHTTLAMSERYNHHDYSEEKKKAIKSAFAVSTESSSRTRP